LLHEAIADLKHVDSGFRKEDAEPEMHLTLPFHQTITIRSLVLSSETYLSAIVMAQFWTTKDSLFLVYFQQISSDFSSAVGVYCTEH
jgi:hypothetical protein